jgi:hypothetical protein
MSTVLTLLDHEKASPQRLRRFLPRFRGHEGERRKMTLVPDIHDWLTKPVASQALIKVKAQARAHFGEFVKGAPVDDFYFMKRIEDRRRCPPSFSHEVWAITPRFDPPQHRYFGVFVTQDWFLVCTKQSRDVLEQHDNRWHAEIDKTHRIWGRLFPQHSPHGGTQLRDYISTNAKHCDDRW